MPVPEGVAGGPRGPNWGERLPASQPASRRGRLEKKSPLRTFAGLQAQIGGEGIVVERSRPFRHRRHGSEDMSRKKCRAYEQDVDGRFSRCSLARCVLGTGSCRPGRV